MTLTPADVHAVRFRTALRGYSTGDVDAFLDRVAAALASAYDENAALRTALALETGATAAGAVPAAAASARGGGSAPTATLPRALPGESGEETALRTLLLAQRRADQVVVDARAEAERLVADARREADERRAEAARRLHDVDREIADRRAEGLAGLAAERQRLEAEVAQLQAFEREYRTRLRAHLESQLQEIDGARRPDEAEVH
ncbi:MAG: DivIVA domain-containing protein [Actinomycetota bacterium]|nr:DivIVA domain-containing protein [Actinomycetota bacterium]